MSNVLIQLKSGDTGVLGTGSFSELLEKATTLYVLTKPTFSFSDADAVALKSNWDTAIANKDIAIMFSVENIANNNAEAAFYETRTRNEKTKGARKGKTFTHQLGLYSQASLRSFENSAYTKIIEITEEGFVKAIRKDDGSISGQSLSNFVVNIREEATLDTTALTTVEVTYADFKELEMNGAIIQPEFNANDLKGIHPVLFSVQSASGSQIVVEAYSGTSPVSSLVSEDFALTTLNGASQTISGVTSVDNTYTLSGSTLESGFLNTDGVVAKAAINYEGVKAKITI